MKFVVESGSVVLATYIPYGFSLGLAIWAYVRQTGVRELYACTVTWEAMRVCMDPDTISVYMQLHVS